MGAGKLDEVMAQVKNLSPAEQYQLRTLLDGLLKRPGHAAEDELEHRLLTAGLLSELKPPITNLIPYQQRRPVKGTGRLLSALIVEERR